MSTDVNVANGEARSTVPIGGRDMRARALVSRREGGELPGSPHRPARAGEDARGGVRAMIGGVDFGEEANEGIRTGINAVTVVAGNVGAMADTVRNLSDSFRAAGFGEDELDDIAAEVDDVARVLVKCAERLRRALLPEGAS